MFQSGYNSGIDKIIPTQFIMLTSGTYQAQHLRNWDIVGSMNDVNKLCDSVLASGANSVSSDLISNITPGLLSVSTYSHGVIGIPNGWNERRGVFVLMFDVHMKVGTIVTWIVQGYTDAAAYTNTALAPDMTFYINNVFNYAKQQYVRNGIPATHLSMISNYQFINPAAPSPGTGQQGNWLIRPEDIMSSISNHDLKVAGADMFDTTRLSAMGLQTSKHSNNVASKMLSETINHWHQSSNEISMVASRGDIADGVYGKIVEQRAEADMFIQILQNATTGFYSPSNRFTFAQLQKAIPEIMRVYTPVVGSSAGVQFSHSGQSEGFQGQGLATSLAVNLQSLIPSIMVECLLSSVGFTMTNMNGQVDAVPLGVQAFDKDIDVRQWNIFKSRIIREIYPMFSSKGLVFALTVNCSFFHEIKIHLQIGGDYVEFIAPAFCNSLYTPVQTPSMSYADDFSNQFGEIISCVGDALQENDTKRAGSKAMVGVSGMQVPSNFSIPNVQTQTPTSMEGSMRGVSNLL